MSNKDLVSKRVFTEEYLREAGILTVDLIKRELEAGLDQQAIDLSHRFFEELQAMFFNYRSWEKGIVRELSTRDGDHFTSRCLAEIEDPQIAPERHIKGKEIIEEWRNAISDLVAEIKANNTSEAIALCNNLFENAMQQHDGMMSRITALLTILYQRHGSDVVETVLQQAMRPEALDPDGSMSFKEKVESIILFVRLHLTPFTLTEDDEKATFMPDPCPSGGRLIQMGHYEAPRYGARISDASDLTWQKKDLPIYCCHEPSMEKSSILKTGVPIFLIEPSNELGTIPCKTFIYKDPADIPERFYDRIGLRKSDYLIASDR